MSMLATFGRPRARLNVKDVELDTLGSGKQNGGDGDLEKGGGGSLKQGELLRAPTGVVTGDKMKEEGEEEEEEREREQGAGATTTMEAEGDGGKEEGGVGDKEKTPVLERSRTGTGGEEREE